MKNNTLIYYYRANSYSPLQPKHDLLKNRYLYSVKIDIKTNLIMIFQLKTQVAIIINLLFIILSILNIFILNHSSMLSTHPIFTWRIHNYTFAINFTYNTSIAISIKRHTLFYKERCSSYKVAHYSCNTIITTPIKRTFLAFSAKEKVLSIFFNSHAFIWISNSGIDTPVICI